MRDHNNLRAFELADQIALQTYQLTRSFPKDELYALTSQMRRAAVSTASNIAVRLEYLSKAACADLEALLLEGEKVLSGLIRSLRKSSGASQ